MPKIEATFSMALQWVALAIKNKQYDLAEDTLSDLINQTHALEKFDNVEKLSNKVIEEVKEIYRSIHPGGCKIISKGIDCGCFLCQCDKIVR